MTRVFVTRTSQTLVRFLRNSKSVINMPEKVEVLIDTVATELAGHVHTSDTDPFLGTLLPVPHATIESILAGVKGTGLYSEAEQRWKGFPTARDAKESLFYKPFEMAAEGIRAAIPAGMKNDLGGQWMDRHDTTPESSEESAEARPDCLFVSRPMAVERLEKQVRELEQKVKQLPADLHLEAPNMTKESLEGQESIWWRQIHIHVEIKKANTNQLFDEGMHQSCCYLRLVLREQLDRRFGIVLLLCREELTVLFNDRSGLFYTKDSINIHAEPLKFIQVITAFSILNPCRIGWDPDMKVYDPESGDTRVSYLIGDETRFFKPNLAKTHWEIDFPSKAKGGREEVITLAALSISRTEVLCGRATLVWEVIRRATPFNPDEIFVLKRYWRPYKQTKYDEDMPTSFVSEGDRYPSRRVPSWENRIYSDEGIRTAEGKNDSTLEHIRHALKMDSSTPEIRSRKRAHPDGEHVPVGVKADAQPFYYVKAEDPVSRVHTQVIHTYTGWPLRHFKDLNELLRVIRDAIKVHKHLYYEGRILHRDISVENIIIMSRNGETVGGLIDLDHAKVADSSRARTMSYAKSKDIQRLKQYVNGNGYLIDEEVPKKFIEYFPEMDKVEAAAYIKAVVKIREQYFGLKADQEIKIADIGWHHQVNDSPDLSTHEAGDGYQTGALPFISIEILNEMPTCELPEDYHEKWCHDAIHDIESFFWVLAYICLVREGPGINMLRRDLLKNEPKLQDLLYSYFDSPKRHEILHHKSRLLVDRTMMNKIILANFSDYFDPLKWMMEQWWHILFLAYKYRKFEIYTIHDQVIHILDNAIEDLPSRQLNKGDEREKRYFRRLGSGFGAGVLTSETHPCFRC